VFREDVILPYVKDKHVLDCGSVDHRFFTEKQENGEWLHASIAKHAKTCLGVDILADRVAEINRIGTYQFVAANVEHLPFDREFDVVVAGELIEHVYNASLFVDCAWRALRDGGILIVTTPNYHAFSMIWSSVIRGREICHEEHTCYYSKQTLEYPDWSPRIYVDSISHSQAASADAVEAMRAEYRTRDTSMSRRTADAGCEKTAASG